MSVGTQADHHILSRLGLVAHLETLRANGTGIENIEVDDYARASSAALRVWEDSNFPYRLPEDLRAFLRASNGFSLEWTARQRAPPPAGGAGGSGEDVVVGRICVDTLSAMTRVPLDADDLRDMASSRARATAAAAAAGKASSFPRRRACPRSSSGSDATSNGEGRSLAGSSVAVDTPSSGGVNTGGYSSAYGIAAFCLDSSCEVGRVALVYGGAPVAGCIDGIDGGSSSNNKHRDCSRGGTKAPTTRELSSPEVWLQDLSCRWHFLADDFTSYFRMMVVHLGIRGWQQAFTPVGLSPNTEQCMRLYCPDRLLFDQLEWHTERANTKAARDAAGGT